MPPLSSTSSIVDDREYHRILCLYNCIRSGSSKVNQHTPNEAQFVGVQGHVLIASPIGPHTNPLLIVPKKNLSNRSHTKLIFQGCPAPPKPSTYVGLIWGRSNMFVTSDPPQIDPHPLTLACPLPPCSILIHAASSPS